MSSRRQSISTALNDGHLDPFTAALWGFDGLPEALATVKQRDALISRAAQDAAAANALETTTETVLNDSASSDAESSTTSQSGSESTEKKPTIYELWADQHGRDTLSGLDVQFSKIWGRSTARITLDEYQQLYQANFLAINQLIESQESILVDAVRRYQADEEHIRQTRLYMEQARRAHSLSLFDPDYGTPLIDAQHGPSPSSLQNHSSVDVDPLSPRMFGNQETLGYISTGATSTISDVDALAESLCPLRLQEPLSEVGARSASWSAPIREKPFSQDVVPSRMRGRSHADVPLPVYPHSNFQATTTPILSASSHNPASLSSS